MQFAQAKHRPKVKSWFGNFVNHVVQADLFVLRDRVFIRIVDDCLRYKFADELKNRSFESIIACLQERWSATSDHRECSCAIRKEHSQATHSFMCATHIRSKGGSLVLTRATLAMYHTSRC